MANRIWNSYVFIIQECDLDKRPESMENIYVTTSKAKLRQKLVSMLENGEVFFMDKELPIKEQVKHFKEAWKHNETYYEPRFPEMARSIKPGVISDEVNAPLIGCNIESWVLD